MATYDQPQQVVRTQYNADQIIINGQAMPRPIAPEMLAAAARQLAALPLETIPDPAPLPEGSRIPFSRNPLFIGREADLRSLAQALKGDGIAAIGQIAAATGLGGLGKTQLAVEFAHRYGPYFAGGVFWLNCAAPEAIPHELASCGGAGWIQLRPDFGTLPLDDQVHLVQRAWQSPLPRLLVLDNCEEPGLIAWSACLGTTSWLASWQCPPGK
jgi:hypothetical protein